MTPEKKFIFFFLALSRKRALCEETSGSFFAAIHRCVFLSASFPPLLCVFCAANSARHNLASPEPQRRNERREKKKKKILRLKRERLVMTALTRCKVSLRGHQRARARTHSRLPFPQHLHADGGVCMASSLLPPRPRTCSQIKPPATSCWRPLKQMASHKLTREPRRNRRAAPLLSAEYPACTGAFRLCPKGKKKHIRISFSLFFFPPPIVFL